VAIFHRELNWTCLSRSHVTMDVQSDSLSWNKAHIWGLRPDFYYSGSCWFVDARRSLWREDRSVFYNCCWLLPAQSFSGLSPLRLETIFYSLRFETSLFSPPTTRRATLLAISTYISFAPTTHRKQPILFTERLHSSGLPAWSIVPQPTTLTRAPRVYVYMYKKGKAFPVLI
jgi:hypothetical protein